jgi:hypothetical protein
MLSVVIPSVIFLVMLGVIGSSVGMLSVVAPPVFLSNEKGRYDTWHNDTQHNGIQLNETQHKWLLCDTKHK